jgi:DNA-directed RNA polymerase II subunit RPB9
MVLSSQCRNCDYSQEADISCVYVNKITHEVDELTEIVADVAQDPTLPRTEDHLCPKCQHNEAVFFQSQSRKSEVCAMATKDRTLLSRYALPVS